MEISQVLLSAQEWANQLYGNVFAGWTEIQNMVYHFHEGKKNQQSFSKSEIDIQFKDYSPTNNFNTKIEVSDHFVYHKTTRKKGTITY